MLGPLRGYVRADLLEGVRCEVVDSLSHGTLVPRDDVSRLACQAGRRWKVMEGVDRALVAPDAGRGPRTG